LIGCNAAPARQTEPTLRTHLFACSWVPYDFISNNGSPVRNQQRSYQGLGPHLQYESSSIGRAPMGLSDKPAIQPHYLTRQTIRTQRINTHASHAAFRYRYHIITKPSRRSVASSSKISAPSRVTLQLPRMAPASSTIYCNEEV
jgi:hypothetical protein